MKRYLTGIDWVINSVDYMSKSQFGIGNVSQVILELKGRLDSRIVQESLNSFIRKFPVVNGLPSRDLNLCPYWKVYPQDTMLPVRVHTAHYDTCNSALLPFMAQTNEPFTHKREHLSFNLVHAGNITLFGMSFDHRLFDAMGAETFLELFQRHYRGEILPQISLTEPPHLNRWLEKFRAGKQVNRAFLGLTREAPRILPRPPRSRLCKHKIVHYDTDRAGRFIDIAYTHAGYLMLMPYALAKTVQIMDRIFESKNISGLTYLIPVSLDTRPQGMEQREMFFNHISFFLFKIEATIAHDIPLLLANIKEQMYEQVKTEFPEAVKNASYLLRIAPLSLALYFLQRMANKHFGSFSFSFVGNTYHEPKFMDAEVQDIFHLPRIPSPPGLGIFFNQYNGRLSATLSYFDESLSEPELEQIIGDLDALGNEG